MADVIGLGTNYGTLKLGWIEAGPGEYTFDLGEFEAWCSKEPTVYGATEPDEFEWGYYLTDARGARIGISAEHGNRQRGYVRLHAKSKAEALGAASGLLFGDLMDTAQYG